MNEERHREIKETLAAWVFSACEPAEASEIAVHVSSCGDCAAEAGRLRAVADQLSVPEPPAPAGDLRAEVLSAALRARKPSAPAGISAPLAEAYLSQIDALDRLLESLTPAHWHAPVAKHGTVDAMIAHLTANDAMFAADMGLPVSADSGTDASSGTGAGSGTGTGQLHRRWRVQARALARYTTSGTALLDREVRLAGSRPESGPARAALIQRTFETWTHADDLRVVIGDPAAPPPPRQLRLIAELGIRLLPRALRAAGRAHPGRTARLTLTGESGGEWVVPLDPGTPPGHPDVTVTADIENFCRLLANRYDPSAFPHEAAGDVAVVADFLYAASTLGCD